MHLTGTEEILKLRPSPASGHSSEAYHVCLGGSSISLGPCLNTSLPSQGKLGYLHPAGTSPGLIYDHHLPFSRHGAQGGAWVQLLSNFLDGSGELLVGLPRTFFFSPRMKRSSSLSPYTNIQPPDQSSGLCRTDPSISTSALWKPHTGHMISE